MQFSITSVFVAALALPAVLAAPNLNVPQADGASLRLTDAGMLQRVAPNGTILEERPMPEEAHETFRDVANQPQSKFRREIDASAIIAPRDCSIGWDCKKVGGGFDDAICWLQGCKECDAGFCHGTIF